jgi:hypothetical protein
LDGDQLGLFGYGEASARFSSISIEPKRPKAFIVMQFGGTYDALWKEVIAPIVDEEGFEPVRVDDVFKPGIILQDIIQGISESDVIVAEISPENANVFYELGYAHALSKPTILLAERGRALPFDIRSYRVIFYDNTISGKGGIERALRGHLANVRRAGR